ncbi:TPA: ABC transporter permease [Legionella pneumophila]|uniref:ABC transporter permease n=1 Tax=Legionella pneumophila TaxID=446 RepID=UPI001A281FFD|nr:ABC transporter permease [Legionella pneumophila]WAI74133.1 ABC transporter permease [Legionella pneumophila]HAU0874283.1 ABC transporter [Legionella pneumophila]HCE5346430.1 ABC transporter permease [Legionella pneumophila]HCE5355686.1 ABC transporter permease [Legionella pneumophila]HCE5413828.1 ABC transporter permease [Legionella pneumophila]
MTSISSKTQTFKETVVYGVDKFRLLAVLRNIWDYRLLLWIFCKRDLKGRYSQTILGLGWVILTPLITVGVFVIVFGIMIKVPTDGLPTVMFYLVAVIPWYSFLNVLNPSIQMIEGNASLITKVYFPRALIGGAYAMGAAVDFLMAYVFLITPFAIYYGLWSIKLLIIMPFLLVSTLMIGLGIGLVLAPINAKYRDIKHFMPLALQLFYYSTPAIYPVSAVPVWAKPWYAVNPLSLVITSYREVLMGHWPSPAIIMTLSGMAIITFLVGLVAFHHMEHKVVDIL